MKRTIRVGMYKMGSHNESFFHFFSKFPALFERYNIVQDNNNPQFLFCGNTIPHSNAINIFYTNEAFGPATVNARWSFGCAPEWKINKPTYFRQPYYVRIGYGVNLLQPKGNAEEILKQKTEFCNFVYNNHVPIRMNFFHELSKYKKIISPGECCQNSPPIGPYATASESRFGDKVNAHYAKVAYIRPFKFTIAFENTCFDGYVSEKIVQGMEVNSIPIFWGNPYIAEDFNTKSFINAHDKKFSNEAEMIEYLVHRVIELDKNDDLYIKMLQEPWLPNNNRMTEVASLTRIYERFYTIFG
jgi:hypothetical protein